jgi:hypothetical protein
VVVVLVPVALVADPDPGLGGAVVVAAAWWGPVDVRPLVVVVTAGWGEVADRVVVVVTAGGGCWDGGTSVDALQICAYEAGTAGGGSLELSGWPT